MPSIILMALAAAAFALAKIAESRGRSADEKMGAIPLYFGSVFLAVVALITLAF